MESMAFTSKGTMTFEEEDNIIEKQQPKIIKRKVIKKSYDVLTPPGMYY